MIESAFLELFAFLQWTNWSLFWSIVLKLCSSSSLIRAYSYIRLTLCVWYKLQIFFLSFIFVFLFYVCHANIFKYYHLDKIKFYIFIVYWFWAWAIHKVERLLHKLLLPVYFKLCFFTFNYCTRLEFTLEHNVWSWSNFFQKAQDLFLKVSQKRSVKNNLQFSPNVKVTLWLSDLKTMSHLSF